MTGAALGAPQAAYLPRPSSLRLYVFGCFLADWSWLMLIYCEKKHCWITGWYTWFQKVLYLYWYPVAGSLNQGWHVASTILCSCAVRIDRSRHKSSTPSPCGRVVADADISYAALIRWRKPHKPAHQRRTTRRRLVTPASSSAASYEPSQYSLHATQALSYRSYLRTANNYSTLHSIFSW
jgi:hypothetical protein